MTSSSGLRSFFILRRRGVEQHGRPQAASNQPSGLLLSARVPRVRNVYGDRQPLMTSSSGLRSFFILRRRGVEQHGRPQAASNQPSGLLLSARVPRVRNVYGDRQPLMTSSSGLRSFFILRRRGVEQHGRPQAASNQPSGLLLSARVPRVRNVYGDRQPLMTSSSGLRSFFILRRRGVEQHGRPTVRTMIWTNNPLDESGRCLCFTETTA